MKKQWSFMLSYMERCMGIDEEKNRRILGQVYLIDDAKLMTCSL